MEMDIPKQDALPGWWVPGALVPGPSCPPDLHPIPDGGAVPVTGGWKDPTVEEGTCCMLGGWGRPSRILLAPVW